MSQRLGDLLVKEKIITPEQLEQATKAQKEQNVRLGSALVKLGFLTDEDVTNFLSRQYGVPAINLSYFEIDPAVVKLIPFETAKRYQILPLSRVGASLTIAMVDPTNVFAMDDIKFMTGFNIEPVVASESSILAGIDKSYGAGGKEEDLETVMQSMSEMNESDIEVQAEEQQMELSQLEKAADEAPVVKLVNLVLTDAVKRGASDIHIEPYEKEFRVRFRIDGVLQAIMSPPMKLKDAITSRLKIMAKLDISEKCPRTAASC
jgi:type IV pilus assembly protein PilB